MDPEGQPALAQFPYASELVIEASASFCAISMTEIRLRTARKPEDTAAFIAAFHSAARGRMNRGDHFVVNTAQTPYEIGE